MAASLSQACGSSWAGDHLGSLPVRGPLSAGGSVVVGVRVSQPTGAYWLFC